MVPAQQISQDDVQVLEARGHGEDEEGGAEIQSKEKDII